MPCFFSFLYGKLKYFYLQSAMPPLEKCIRGIEPSLRVCKCAIKRSVRVETDTSLMCNLGVPMVLPWLIRRRQVRLNWDIRNIRGPGFLRGKHEKHSGLIADAAYRHKFSSGYICFLASACFMALWLCLWKGRYGPLNLVNH